VEKSPQSYKPETDQAHDTWSRCAVPSEGDQEGSILRKGRRSPMEDWGGLAQQKREGRKKYEVQKGLFGGIKARST